MVDDDGFQHVRHRRSTRRNIFDAIDDDWRRLAFEQREACRAASDLDRHTCMGTYHRAWEDERLREAEGSHKTSDMGNERTYTAEEPGARTAENLSKATMELKSTCAKRNKDQAGPILDHSPSLGSETNVQMREAGESTAAEADAEEEENGRGRPSNTKTTCMHAGKGDPTSTMMWSPGKRAGQKRSLQAREEAEAKSVTESGEIREGDTDEESEGESGESRQEEEEAVEAEADMDTVRLATNINTQVTRAEKELEESRVAEAPATQTTTQ